MNEDFHFNCFEKIQSLRDTNRFWGIRWGRISEREDGLVGIVNPRRGCRFDEDGDLRDRNRESISIRVLISSLVQRCCVHFECEMAETEEEEIGELVLSAVRVEQ